MNPQTPSFGSGSPLLGGMQQVAQGMMQPGGSNVLTQQQSPSAPGFNENTTIPPQPPMPNQSPMNNFAQGLVNRGQPGQSAQGAKPPKNPLHARAELIVKALTAHLALLDKLMGIQHV
ncbi:MAG: hypothetical protein KGI72_05160 [Patescibacteria group bacterium]|nr:hypothetical protein [Patescibacteria group bacterium]MDE2015881.1 hypothetical protein [Patescibacteria group bacterium]